MQFEPINPGTSLAFLSDKAAQDGRCGLFWLGGFMSDMTGSKAQVLSDWARSQGRPCLRFDYSGHGASGGDFLQGAISRWLAEALHMFRNYAPGPRIIVGSSMGGWLASLLYRALGDERQRVKGLILIAPAHDMTDALMWRSFSPEARTAIQNEGVWHRPSAYGSPYPITRGLIEDGRRHLVLDRPQPVDCPVRILQGNADADVPWTHAMRIFDSLQGSDIRLDLIKQGDHRLSRPADLAFLIRSVEELIELSGSSTAD